MMKEPIENLKKSQKQKIIDRDLYFLKRLLIGIKREDRITFKEVKKKLLHYNFRQNLMISSLGNEVYRHVSIGALVNQFNRKVSYSLHSSISIIDIWFSPYDNADKIDVMNTDILIIYGSIHNRIKLGPIIRVLQEIIEYRKSHNKYTWIFLNEVSEEKLKEIHDELGNSIDAEYKFY